MLFAGSVWRAWCAVEVFSVKIAAVCMQIFCLHGGLSPTLDTLDHIRALDRVQEVSSAASQATVHTWPAGGAWLKEAHLQQ